MPERKGMNICCIGTGYVGLCSGVGFASKGHRVVCVGRKQEKIDKINQGIPPIFEEGLEQLLKELRANGTLEATSDLEKVVREAEVVFLCVGTPSGEDGRIDLTQMETASKQVGAALGDHYTVIVVKSTVVPGTTEKMISILEEASGKRAGEGFGVCMNPEFLREGKALEDFLKPDRIVIGALDQKSGDVLVRLYEGFGAPVLRTDLKTAEMIKYASNSLLATKISFANEVGNLCKVLGVNVSKVMEGVGMDARLNPRFLSSGIGFGGSCFPKDVSALASLSEDSGLPAPLLKEVLAVNRRQRMRMIDLVEQRLGSVDGKIIGVLGLAFKGGTDDVREAPSLDIVRVLLEKGATVKAYDPQALDHVTALLPSVQRASSVREAVEQAEACLVLAEWEEFASLEEKDFAGMKNKLILEGRDILNKEKIEGVEGICW